MTRRRVFSLEPIRTDGWFERIGEGIGSFQALCEIIGPRFFAFAMITGARIVALTVDRRNPDNTLVDFAVVAETDAAVADDADTQRLTLPDFRRRVVAALLSDELFPPAPTRATDTEALQLHVGVRYLLLAPLYGYSLVELAVEGDDFSEVTTLHDGIPETYGLEAFRERLRGHVREELTRAGRGSRGSSIDLGRVEQAEQAAAEGDHVRVLELLGAWPAPLAIFLRTPDGQLLAPDARAMIAKGLALLGSACIALEEVDKGEEVLRLAVQYAGDTDAAADIYLRLGQSMLHTQRPGEAIAPLRRAANLGAPGETVWPLLGQALLDRGRYMAALGAFLEARQAGVPQDELSPMMDRVEAELGPSLGDWRRLVEAAKPE